MRMLLTPMLLSAALCSICAAPAAAATIEEFPAAGEPLSITTGSDGNLWYTASGTDEVVRVAPSGAELARIDREPFAGLSGIIAGPDGNIWFAEIDRNRIGRVSTTGVELPDVVLPSGGEPVGLALGPDGNVWVTLTGRGSVGRVSQAGIFLGETPLPGDRLAEAIAAGPDGALWYTAPDDNLVGRITVGGTVTEFPLPSPDSGPTGITAGADGAVWFAQTDGNRIGRITPAGAIAEFPVPTADSAPENLALGPDGNVWFTEAEGNQIGRITPSGTITEFGGLTPGSEPLGITQGPDGRMWFTELAGNRIGRVTLDPPAAITGAATAVTQTGATLQGSVDPNAAATTYWFEYGVSTQYGSATPETPAGAGDAAVLVEAALSGLEPGVTYHYRLVARSAVGTSYGADATFVSGATAPPPPPPAPPAPPPPTAPPGLDAARLVDLEPRAVTLSATLNPNGLESSYRAECGREDKYWLRSRTQTIAASSGARTVEARIRGLNPGSVYQCRFVATNGAGTTNGSPLAVRAPIRLRLSFGDRTLSVAAGAPVTLPFRASTSARVRAVVRRCSDGVTERRASVYARRGSNRFLFRGFAAGCYRMRVTARSSDGQRTAARVTILSVAPALPSYTG
jgi:streptogramin lyase